MRAVTVFIPTFRRNISFERAVRSVFAQQIDFAAEIVVIDNSPEGAALSVCARLQEESPLPMRYAHEPRPGVAFARNAGVALARADWIAFLDDDQEAPPHWLRSLVNAAEATRADALFGPVSAEVEAPNEWSEHLKHLHTRTGPAVSGIIYRYYGVGNSLLRRRALLKGPTPFAPTANETGGEDDLLFSAAQRSGVRFAWVAEAKVTEHVPADRACLRYALRRSFAYGQGPCETAFAKGDFVGILRHMGVGAGQFAAYGALAFYGWGMHSESRLDWLDRCIRGLGKVFWFTPQKFYGAALARTKPSRRSISTATGSLSV
jgi:glycosyltransferase involved in cell wall biosynthesis